MKKKAINQRPKFHFERGQTQNKICPLITKEMTIGEVIKKYPKTIFVFIDYELHCLGCPMAIPETIEQAANLHRLDLKKFLVDLNKAIKK